MVPDAIAEAFEGKAMLTPAETAAVLRICERTLREHVRRGEITFRAIGSGGTRQRRMFGLDDVMDFLDRQRRTKCPSITPRTGKAGRNRRSGTTTSNSWVVDFTALRAELAGRKPSK